MDYDEYVVALEKKFKSIVERKFFHSIFPKPVRAVIKAIESSPFVQNQMRLLVKEEVSVQTFYKNIGHEVKRRILVLIGKNIKALILIFEVQNKFLSKLNCMDQLKMLLELKTVFARSSVLGFVLYFPREVLYLLDDPSRQEVVFFRESRLAGEPGEEGSPYPDGYYMIKLGSRERKKTIKWVKCLLQSPIQSIAGKAAQFLVRINYDPAVPILSQYVQRQATNASYRSGEWDVAMSLYLLARLNRDISIKTAHLIIQERPDNRFLIHNACEILLILTSRESIVFLQRFSETKNGDIIMRTIEALSNKSTLLYGNLLKESVFRWIPVRRLFKKDGDSELHVVGGWKIGKRIIRIMPQEHFKAWKRAHDAGIPVEPILKHKTLRDGREEIEAKIVGVPVREFLRIGEYRKYSKPIKIQMDSINLQLANLKIKHGHIHHFNFTVELLQENGKIVPKVYIIDFDLALIKDS